MKKAKRSHYTVKFLLLSVALSGVLLFIVILATLYEVGGGNGAVHLAGLNIIATMLKWLIKIMFAAALIFLIIGVLQSKQK